MRGTTDREPHHQAPQERPAGRPHLRGQRRRRYRDAGPQAVPRPALRRAALRRGRQRPPRPARRQGLVRAPPQGAPQRSLNPQDLPLRPLRPRHAGAIPRRHHRARLLHQDRLQARPHLHRPPRPQGPVLRAPGRRPFQAAAELRLGCREADRPAAALRRLRRAASARPEGEARRHAAAGGPDGDGGSLLPIRPAAGQAGPRRLRGHRHLRPLIAQPARAFPKSHTSPVAWALAPGPILTQIAHHPGVNRRAGRLRQRRGGFSHMATTIAPRGGQRLGNLAPPSVVRIGERARAFAAAQRHSRLVGLLRISLPLAAGGILAGFVLYVAFKYAEQSSKFKPGSIIITTEDLQMKDPSFVDVTSDGRYEVRAKRAIVAFTPNAPVKLIDVSGDLIQTSGTVTKLKAKHGLYERAKGELELFDGIEIDGSNGMMARLSRATVYSKQSKVVSEHPVSASTPTGSVQASAMTLETKKRLAQFRGAVAVRLVQSAQAVGLGADARKPVDVRSETLDIDDAQKTAHFRGEKVVAIQGETMLQAPYLMVKYEGKAAAALDSAAPKAPAGQEGTRVTFLWARNGVEITAGNDRRIASELVDFDVAADTALFVGKVVATQEKNVLKGERLFVDRKAGTSRLETPDRGRIYATFYQNPGAQPPRPKRNPTADAVQQTMTGSFKSDPNAPMDIEANTLDVHETAGKAIFKGDVRAQQGDLLLRALELTAFYSGQGGLGLAGATASDGAKEKGQVTRLEARNGVRIISNDGHSASGKWANLDVKANTALLGGGVFITKPGEDPTKPGAIKGDRLKIDLTTGISHVESEAQAILHPSKVPPTGTGPALSSSPPANAPPTASEKMEGCPPGRTCMLLYPKQVKDKALEVVKKKKAPEANAP